MSVPPLLHKTWETLLDWVFPPKCGGCGRAGQWFCDACQSQVAYIEAPHVLLPYSGLSPENSPSLRQVHAVAWFEGPLQNLIHNFKYKGQRVLRKPLAQLLLEKWRAVGQPTDLIIAVPLHPSRERERGYNQSYLLSQELGQAIGIEAPKNGLHRVRNTLPQVDLTAQERWLNVQGAFRGDTKVLGGRSVLLVDDVCTTGATLQACASAAFEAGAQAVWALTVARPRHDQE